MKYKVAAYITVYKDKCAVHKCIKAINSQTYSIAKIFIIDNSEKSIFCEHAPNIIVKHYPDNVGIGEGIKQGIEWAIKENYDFLWMFDQDSIPTKNCLEVLLINYHQLLQKDNYKVGIIAPTPCDPRTNQFIEGASFINDHFVGFKHNDAIDFYECDSPITSGSLISLASAKTISLPRPELFIDGIDLDYGLRLRQKGFHNLIVTKAIMYHNFGEPMQVKFINKYQYIQKYSALRHYYICRNHTYLETRFAKGHYRFTSLIRRIKYMLSRFFLIALYDSEDKQIKIWACLLGTYHGLLGKLGKIW